MDFVPLTALGICLALTSGCQQETRTESSFSDDLDNDGNGLTDCDDPACAGVAACQGPVCGDGVVEGFEACDGADLGAATCVSEGFDGGVLSCDAATCQLDTRGCTLEPTCGDGVINGVEACDGTDLGAATCVSEGFDGGSLSCDAATCQLDTGGCSVEPICGDGVINGTEACDGTDLDGLTCELLGHSGGTLSCHPTTCLFDEAQCTDGVVCDTLEADETTALQEGASHYEQYGYWVYSRVMDVRSTYPAVLSVQLYTVQSGAPELGAHALGVGVDANYATCIYCPMLLLCADAQCTSAETTFFPTAGTLTLTALGTSAGSTIAGSLENVSWVEVTIDPNTFVSTPVAGGACSDLGAQLTFDATVTVQ